MDPSLTQINGTTSKIFLFYSIFLGPQVIFSIHWIYATFTSSLVDQLKLLLLPLSCWILCKADSTYTSILIMSHSLIQASNPYFLISYLSSFWGIQASNPILGWTLAIPSSAHIRLLWIAWRPIYIDLLGFKNLVYFKLFLWTLCCVCFESDWEIRRQCLT